MDNFLNAEIRDCNKISEISKSDLLNAQAESEAEGVQIFIGAENYLFKNAGCSMIIAPYHDKQKRVVGALGVIGPLRMNYARIIPVVDYTSKLVGKLLD